ncbi:hypothetical protein EVAR_65750_1 [Eumeta japonica]|uniref:Uncharacterized protein n=1 Tax=Eumeta variegata TaxID=151549 RepID=A0A4C1ZPW6_EUMVA|nr:hypothetical protein EVAR_65750_1 [Eumeta japonica]
MANATTTIETNEFIPEVSGKRERYRDSGTVVSITHRNPSSDTGIHTSKRHTFTTNRRGFSKGLYSSKVVRHRPEVNKTNFDANLLKPLDYFVPRPRAFVPLYCKEVHDFGILCDCKRHNQNPATFAGG